MIKTYNFKIEEYDYETQYKGEQLDRRNGIICINPTADLECYLNYIEFLNLNRDKWKTYGYLDLGMMPLVSEPSFMQGVLANVLVKVAKIYGIPCYMMPSVSLFFDSCKLAEDDIWVFKSDVAKCTKIPEDKLTLERFIKECVK